MSRILRIELQLALCAATAWAACADNPPGVTRAEDAAVAAQDALADAAAEARRYEPICDGSERLRLALVVPEQLAGATFEMLTTELGVLEKNAKKVDEVRGRRVAVFETLLSQLRRCFTSDPKAVDAFLENFAKANGVPPPGSEPPAADVPPPPPGGEVMAA